MKFTGKFIGAKLNLSTYEKELKKHLERELHRVVQAWLRGVTGKVPIWSGMSQASLLELVELVNGELIITPKQGIINRIAEGERLGVAIPHYELPDFKITFTTSVPHYVLQEHKNVGVSKSAPWLSFKAGLEEAQKEAKTVSLLIPLLKAIKIKGI